MRPVRVSQKKDGENMKIFKKTVVELAEYETFFIYKK